MRITLTSLVVTDQDKALQFYTDILGFVKKREIPLGEHKWLTVVAKDDQEGVELVLEPRAFPPAKVYYEELFKAGIPATAFNVDSVEDEYNRLSGLGVNFSLKPTVMGTTKITVLDDTCGNNIQLYEML
jgi:catechol 2,3-dioxygenase-like lactoylglutathione lyase family enzyme